MTSIVVAVAAGLVIGGLLGLLGGGGSILAVPALVYLLGHSAAEATTGSLVVVSVTSLLAAVSAHRHGTVQLRSGLVFGLVTIAGAAVGAVGSGYVPEPWLMTAFAGLMLVVGALMIVREVRGRGGPDDKDGTHLRVGPCLLVAATVVGLITGFLGVGGGFLIVPALLTLGLSMRYAAGTSLVVVTITSVAALGVRLGTSAAQPDWWVIAVLTVSSAVAAAVGARDASRAPATLLSRVFIGLVLVVAVYTAIRSVPALV